MAIGFLRSYSYVNWGMGSTGVETGESWGVEWFPRRMIEGRELELDARFEIAWVWGSTNTCAISTCSGSLWYEG